MTKEKKKEYKFRIMLNPYNGHAAYRIVKINGKEYILRIKNPVTPEITLKKGGNDDFVNEIYRGIVAGLIFVIGDIPEYKKIDDDTIRYLENISKLPKNYTHYEIDIDKEYAEFIGKLKSMKEGK